MKKQYRIINVGKGILNINAANLHRVTEDKDVIVNINKVIIFKKYPNTNPNTLEIGDSVTGYIQNQYLVDAVYKGGDIDLLTSYENF
jgi:hypothetical protein